MPDDTPAPAAPVPSPRQTLSYLHRLFEGYGLEAKSRLGQNFLIDLNLVDLVVRTAELDRSDAVLEVGTGTGSLTSRLADVAGAVVTIEIDRSLQPVAKEVVGERPNVKFLFGDALAKKNELNPDMLAAWDEFAKAKGCTRRKLVANLPYVIATPLISNLLIAGTEIVRMVVPSNFHPRPKVDSAIVLIKPNAEKRAKVGDVPKFRAFLRDLYVHRRKNLRQALVGWPSGHRDKKDVDAKLAELGIDGTVRSEALDL